MGTIEQAQVQLAQPVQISVGLSCGCRLAKSEPMPNLEANLHPGTVVICDRHEEYAVVVRVSAYLHDLPATMPRLLQSAGLDPDTAACIAGEHLRGAR